MIRFDEGDPARAIHAAEGPSHAKDRGIQDTNLRGEAVNLGVFVRPVSEMQVFMIRAVTVWSTPARLLASLEAVFCRIYTFFKTPDGFNCLSV
jgi:hypothetical protein